MWSIPVCASRALGIRTPCELPIFRIATVCFLAGVVFFLSALVCFLIETLLATHLLNFAELPAPVAQAAQK